MPPRSIKSLRETMPIIYSNEGVWEGWYRYFDIDGNKIDEENGEEISQDKYLANFITSDILGGEKQRENVESFFSD